MKLLQNVVQGHGGYVSRGGNTWTSGARCASFRNNEYNPTYVGDMSSRMVLYVTAE